jgi:uncharacterized protein YegL
MLKKVSLGLCASLLVALVACGSSDGSEFGDIGAGGFTNGRDGNGDGLGGSGAGGIPDFERCATSTAAAEAKPPFLVFMFDRSGSMTQNGSPKWASCKAATEAFFQSPDSAGMHASLHYFPQGNACGAATFAAPAVAMQPLPSNAFKTSLDAQVPSDGTPTRPALEGAIQYGQQVAQGIAKDGKVVVVLVTDGEPNDCSSSIGSVSNVAQNASAQFQTYVIGVGNINGLNQIAAAGGTKQAFAVPTNNPTQIQADFTKAMNVIKNAALACDYTIPAPPTGETFDRAKVNVLYKPGGGAPQALDYNQDCNGGVGWRYDDMNSPKRILVCDGSCDAIKAKPGAVDVVFGCATKTVGVK